MYDPQHSRSSRRSAIRHQVAAPVHGMLDVDGCFIFLSSSLLTGCSLHVAISHFSCLLKRQACYGLILLENNVFFPTILIDEDVMGMLYLLLMLLTRLGSGRFVDHLWLLEKPH